MAHEGQLPSTAARSLTESYAACISGFRDFSTNLARPNCRVVCRQQVSPQDVAEQYGRLLTWGEQSRAVLPARARGSLDELVRDSGRIRAVIQNTLQQLKELLNMGKSCESLPFVAEWTSHSNREDVTRL